MTVISPRFSWTCFLCQPDSPIHLQKDKNLNLAFKWWGKPPSWKSPWWESKSHLWTNLDKKVAILHHPETKAINGDQEKILPFFEKKTK